MGAERASPRGTAAVGLTPPLLMGSRDRAGDSSDDEIRGSQADCLLAPREPSKLRPPPPPPCLDITCSLESQITGAIDLHDLS